MNWFSDEVYYAVNEKLFYVTGLFLYLNATINPIVMNQKSNINSYFGPYFGWIFSDLQPDVS